MELGATLRGECVEFVEEDDAGNGRPGTLEDLAYGTFRLANVLIIC
jgi:hypothetical protein